MLASKARGFGEASIRLKSLWESFKALMGAEIQVKEADVDVPFGSLTLEFKNRPTSRQKLREGVERLSAHQSLLYYLYVLEYQNGRQWYEVNPVIRELNRFRNG